MIEYFRGQHFFLSNFAPLPAAYAGVIYPTGEHAFQAAKSTEASYRDQVLKAADPNRAKYLGRSVQLRPNWNEIRLAVMSRVVADKFSRSSHARDLLLGTGHELLREGNTWHDLYWGAFCSCGQRRGCDQPGANHLGAILMAVRETMHLF